MKKITFLFILFSAALIYGCSDENGKSCSGAPVVSAGDDMVLTNETTVTLAGTTTAQEGTWTIVDGTGGEIHTGTTITFTGKLKSTYLLKWESTNDCGTSSDQVKVTLNPASETRTIEKVVENLHWIEQSCFRIETGGVTLYTDPKSITQKDTADIIVITHPHGDHYSTADLDLLVGPNTILIAPEEVTYAGKIGQRIIQKPGDQAEFFGCVTIKAVPAYNIVKTSFHAKASNWVGYLITVNGVTLYHAGDTELIPEMKTFTCDVAMLSLGQTYTFDKVEDAVQAAKDVKAKLAIPMHFGLYEGTSADATSFKNLLDGVIPVVIKVKEK